MGPSAEEPQPPAASASPPAGSLPKKRVPSACQRCKQQKLKCDVQRPCTLCLRAGATCSPAIRATVWKNHGPNQGPKRSRSKPQTVVELPAAKRSRPAAIVEDTIVASVASTAPPSPGRRAAINASTRDRGDTSEARLLSPPRDTSASPWTSSSAAVQFMEEAFHQHDTNSPGGPETSAFSASHWTQGRDPSAGNSSAARFSASPSHGQPLGETQKEHHGPRHTPSGQHPRICTRRGMTSPAEAELLTLLPPKPAVSMLVDIYFDKVHWFMLLFHQSDFRDLFRQLYEILDENSRPKPSGLGLSFVSLFAAVCVVSLRYIDTQRKARLSEYGMQADILQQSLLMTLRLRLLDIVSQGSIEAVQVCVLVGSFHLYHGEPELAWPICGCGLRIAQALNLHRKNPKSGATSGPPDLDDPDQRAEETRKRTWWTVYELETTCSMIYGFPLSINDDDCDVQFLNPYPLRSGDPSWDATVWQQTGQATLLSYKHAMGHLAVIIKSALTELYGLRQKPQTNRNLGGADKIRLQELVVNVTKLDKRLHEWHARLPLQLRPANLPGASLSTAHERYMSDEGESQAGEVEFRNRLFQLQALALKVAFENAKIMIHRPLLSYRTFVPSAKSTMATVPSTLDTCQSSVHVCRDAALEISNIGSLPIFQGIADTYAVSFVSLRLLTAGVALSILTTLSPLTQESHDCKMGIRRLMEMQSRLNARSIVAEQGLGILKKLMELVLTKEMKEMLEFPRRPSGGAAAAAVARDEVVGDNNLNSVPMASDEPQLSAGQRRGASETTLPPINQTSDTTSGEMRATLTMPADISTDASSGLNFYEDPTITQALLDFEQAVSYIPDASAGGTIDLADVEYSSGSCFSIQDQSWIWGSNGFS